MILIGQLLMVAKPSSNRTKPSEKNIEIQIVFPDKQMQSESSSCLNLRVLIINHTDTVASFFEDWNSWGYFNLSFQVTTTNLTYTLHKRDRDWPKNFPSFKTLFPGDTISFTYSLEYDYCTSSQFAGTISRTNNQATKIKVVYQLLKTTLDHANLTGDIKYKTIYKRSGNSRRGGSSIIVDSLKNAVEVNRTFPLSKMESIEYELW